jgi:hypothetical protein
MGSFVRVMLAGGGPFAKLECKEGDDVSDLVRRACTEFSHWKANTGQVVLFLVPPERARTIEFNPYSAGDILLGQHLFSADSLAAAGVTLESYLLARILVPPSDALATSGGEKDTDNSLLLKQLAVDVAAMKASMAATAAEAERKRILGLVVQPMPPAKSSPSVTSSTSQAHDARIAGRC